MNWNHCLSERESISRAKQTLSLDGVLLIDKPYECSSFDVIRRLKHRFGFKKIGHAGTLDPLATGLLIIVLGKATKLSQQLMCGFKEYTGTIQLGVETSTYDKEGEVLKTMSTAHITEQQIKAAMASFLGDQYQKAPMFSAKKLNGTPLYKFARKGQEIERAPNFITLFKFDMLSYQASEIAFYVRCSKGTYIRSLAHDLGEKLGCGAHLAALRRTKSGRFSVEHAVALETLIESPSLDLLRQMFIPYETLLKELSL